MPFYDYKCGKCGKTFEASHGMSGKPEGLKCEFCGSVEILRVFQPVGMMKAGGDLSAGPSGSSCSSCSSGACGSCH